MGGWIQSIIRIIVIIWDMKNHCLRWRISSKIRRLNRRGVPVIFMISGNNSSGKTVVTRTLIQTLPFSQSVNLGLASKMIKYFRPDIDSTELENFNGNEASKIFNELLEFMIDSYVTTGVNVIFDGVQVSSKSLNSRSITGGVFLDVRKEISLKRGDRPETHFNRIIGKLKKVKYVESDKFIRVDNNGRIDDAVTKVLEALDQLLDKQING